MSPDLSRKRAMEENKQEIKDEEFVISGRKMECIIMMVILWWIISLGAGFVLGMIFQSHYN